MAEEIGMPMPGEEIPEPPKKKGVLSFGGHKKEDQQVDLSEVTSDINSLSRRLRLLEEGSANIRNMLQITEENLVSKNKTIGIEIKTLTSDINDLRKEMHELKEKVLMIIRELQSAARKEDVKLLEKYISLWNPVKFVTRGELDYVVKEAVEDAISKREDLEIENEKSD